MAFEDFTIYGSCQVSSDALPVWLYYGGDESDPVTYCCGDHSRQPGDVVEIYAGTPLILRAGQMRQPRETREINAQKVSLRRDAQYEEFQKRVEAVRNLQPDGSSCADGRTCYFYDVSATLTGYFFSAQTDEAGTVTSGYGHMGFTHALFIERVSDVEARRTGVPAGGTFDCRSETWDAPLPEVKHVLSDYEECETSQSCAAAQENLLRFAARHWEGAAAQYRTWVHQMPDEKEESWSSPDLLTTYDFKFPDINPNIGRFRRTLTITRTKCSPKTNPMPQTVKIVCERPLWDATNPEGTAKDAQERVDHGAEAWRLDMKRAAWEALQNAARERNFMLFPNLAFTGCETYTPDNDEIANCSWTSTDGMQAVRVVLRQYGSLVSKQRPRTRTVWAPLAVGLDTCRGE